MWVEFKSGSRVRNWGEDQTPGSEWFPDDTQVGPGNDAGQPTATGYPRVLGPDYQASDWPDRAARRWDGERWVSTGGQTGEKDIEKAIRRLRNNPVPELPASPTSADIVKQVRLHQQYIEGYRKILVRMLTFIIKRLGREFFHG